jgi:hypothetical protein
MKKSVLPEITSYLDKYPKLKQLSGFSKIMVQKLEKLKF